MLSSPSSPQNLMVAIPEGVDFDQAAFATVGAVALQGFRLADVQVGSRVAVIGLGLLGLLATGLASAAGCEVLGHRPRPAASCAGQIHGCSKCRHPGPG